MPNQKIVTETALSALASDIKNALSGKANSNDVYPKSQTYNRTEIDNALALKADKSELYNVYPTDQENGAIAHFTDGADNVPVKSLVSEIVAVESGSGEKSPTNPYTISGFNNGVVSVCGKNFLEPTLLATSIVNGITFTALSDGTIRANGTATANAILMINNITGGGNLFDNLLPLNNVACIGSGCPSVAGCRIAFARMDGSSFYDERGSGVSFTVGNLTPTTNAYVRLQIDSGYTVNNVIFKPMIRLASVVDDTYEAYNGNDYTFAFGQTVFFGYFDNNGNLVVTHGTVDLGGLSWSYATSAAGTKLFISNSISNIKRPLVYDTPNIICPIYIAKSWSDLNAGGTASDGINIFTDGSVRVVDNAYTDANAFKTAMSGVMLVYELDTPITLAITSQDIPTLLGENNIFSNCGDVEVNYHADIGLYIDKKISSLAQG